MSAVPGAGLCGAEVGSVWIPPYALIYAFQQLYMSSLNHDIPNYKFEYRNQQERNDNGCYKTIIVCC